MSYFDLTFNIDAIDVSKFLGNLLEKVSSTPPFVEQDCLKHFNYMVEIAKGLCPKGATGRLSESIRLEGSFPSYVFIADAVNEQGQSYGAFIEWGTSKMPPQPFMYPAIEAVSLDLWQELRMHYRLWLLER